MLNQIFTVFGLVFLQVTDACLLPGSITCQNLPERVDLEGVPLGIPLTSYNKRDITFIHLGIGTRNASF